MKFSVLYLNMQHGNYNGNKDGNSLRLENLNSFSYRNNSYRYFPVNQRVAGSSPASGAKKNPHLQRAFYLLNF